MRNVAIMLALLLGAFCIALAVGLDAGHAGRVAIATVFSLTAVGHFAKPTEMLAMLPAWVPSRRLVVVGSGFLELALAAAMLTLSGFRAAAVASIVFLVLATPLNVYSAVKRVDFGGHGAGPAYLLVRIPLQALLIAWIWWFSFRAS
jgi:uncharacterized membrane protein